MGCLNLLPKYFFHNDVRNFFTVDISKIKLQSSLKFVSYLIYENLAEWLRHLTQNQMGSSSQVRGVLC